MSEIPRLWKLAQIDKQIVEIRKRAAALDVGQQVQKQIEVLQGEEQLAAGKARLIKQEITDLELGQKSADDKRKKIDREIFGGKVVNPKEVQNLQKELEIIKRNQDSEAERLLELYDLLPPANAVWEEAQAKVREQGKVLAEKRQGAAENRKKLEEAFARLTAQRPEATKGISQNLLARYETIRKNHGGIGMAEIDKKLTNCTGCGTHVPERALTLVKEDKLAVCESCHRILYYSEGVV